MDAWLVKIRLIAIIAVAALTFSISPGSAAPTGVVYFDLVIDEARQVLYGSDQMGNKIDVLSMATLEVISTIEVGSQPTGMDIDPSGNELAVALSGQSEIAFINLETPTVIDRVTPQGISIGPNFPYDVLYGRPGRLYSVGNPGSSGIDYVHVFNTDTKKELGRSQEGMMAAPRLAITDDQNALYVSQVTFSPEQIYRFDISTDIPVQDAVGPHGPVSVNTLCVMPDGNVFSSSGQVWSADLSTLITILPHGGDEIECSETDQKVYIGDDTTLYAYDSASYQSLWSLNYHNDIGATRVDETETYLYTSTSLGIEILGTGYQQQSYMPFMSDPSQSIHGYVTVEGEPASYVELELRFFNGSAWSTRATAITDYDGFYAFYQVPSLEPGQIYYVRYLNPYGSPYYLWFWGTRELTEYAMGSPVHIGDFDILNITLTAPPNGATVALPYSFTWTPRLYSPTDMYEFNLYDYSDLDPYLIADMGYSGTFTLNTLPPGFTQNYWYAWEIWIYSPDGGIGKSFESRLVAFSFSGLRDTDTPMPSRAKPARNLDDLPNR